MAKRIVSAIVQYVITETDANGEPIGEEISQPIRQFRAIHQDIWARGDKLAFPPADNAAV